LPSGKWARISWDDNWVAFLDTMLQFPVVCKETRGLYLPTRLQRAAIDPEAFYGMIQNNVSVSTEGKN
jgi:fatty acid synthase